MKWKRVIYILARLSGVLWLITRLLRLNLGVRPQSVDYMLTRKSIDTDTLYNVSRALNYDFAMLYSLHEGQTNCDIKESSYNVATAKVLVELELKPEDLAKLNLKKRISDVLK